MNEEKKMVVSFNEGEGNNKKSLGGKGAGLCAMTQAGINVPPGFVITTEACLSYLERKELPMGFMESVFLELGAVEESTGKKFGGLENPLLVSVRSSGAVSMPGMMDTILNLGLNKETLSGLIKKTGDSRFAYDAWRRFIQLFGSIALGISTKLFEEILDDVKKKFGAKSDLDLTNEHLAIIASLYLDLVQEKTREPFPTDPHTQLEIAIKAVFKSWNGDRAVAYREQFGITPSMANGTAVVVQAMVFGNMGGGSATGVGFTRDPGKGTKIPFGEYLPEAQGEDVVSGIRTPSPISQMKKEAPEMYHQVVNMGERLENHFGEVQDYEYTIEARTLFILQSRNAHMSGAARVKTAVDMWKEGRINQFEMFRRITPADVNQMLNPQVKGGHGQDPIARGLAASLGAGSGVVVFDPDIAKKRGDAGEKVVLLRRETSPSDIHGFFASKAVVAKNGGITSHAAVVARKLGLPCVTGVGGLEIDEIRKTATIGDHVIREGDTITVDGTSGRIYHGELVLIEPEFTPELQELLELADSVGGIPVYANADTPEDAKKALVYGARGIKLCRTERGFNDQGRLATFIGMILAKDAAERQKYLDILLPSQIEDATEILISMEGKPVTSRLLDAPIHEFLPSVAELEQKKWDALFKIGNSSNNDDEMWGLFENIAQWKKLSRRSKELHQINPMHALRGVRLGLVYPEIYQMQIRALLEATAICTQKGKEVYPEIMVPQVATLKEFELVKAMIDEIKAEIERREGLVLSVKVGTMIETVRSCLRADMLALIADFFSGGTNDLTAAVMSLSREDVETTFLQKYLDLGILRNNPFESFDEFGVVPLLELALEKARKVKPNFSFTVCGEHGGDPRSIAICAAMGMSGVSCSVNRIPAARLASAQAKLGILTSERK